MNKFEYKTLPFEREKEKKLLSQNDQHRNII